MDSIYLRLKEMDPDTFQRFSFQILKEQHPGLELRHVEGKSGDEGLDLFVGELYGRPAIWQCKAFPDGVGKSQKAQIKHSLRTALKNFTPAFWILCLSVDLDSKAYRWFDRLKKSYESKVKIGLMPASDFVNEVLHRRTLRNHFFPNATVDAVELKRLASRSGEMTQGELETVTAANAEDIIERFKERDARFNYEIVFGGDLGPPQNIPPRAGLVASISKGPTTINVMARDIASLLSNPPKFKASFKGSGLKKYIELVKTGKPQEFDINEVGHFETDVPPMSDLAKVSQPFKIKIGPSPLSANRKRSVRTEFVGVGGDTVRYELMELSPVRGGTDEFELLLSGRNVPFTISVVVFPNERKATVDIRLEVSERNPRRIKKSLDALSLLRPSGKLRLFDLESELLLFEQNCELAGETEWQRARRAFVSDIVSICERFGVELTLPQQALADSDLETIYALKQYMQNGAMELGDIALTVSKSTENSEIFSHQLAVGRGFFKFVSTPREGQFALFGTTINTGLVVMETEAEINNPAETLAEYERASIGADITLSLKPLTPVHVGLVSGDSENADTQQLQIRTSA